VARDRRALNEHRRKLFAVDGNAVAYVCECADPACFTTVPLNEEQLRAIRPGLILAWGHGAPRPGLTAL
jgi:hypothetical protein